jgi:hypothetical protein
MPQPLIGPWTLITESWTTFTKTWDTTIRISVWFIVVGILSAFVALIPQSIPGYLLIVIMNIAGVLVSIWATIRLFQAAFAIERNEKLPTPQESSRLAILLIWPVICVQALAGLAALGGFLLLILPGIYIGIRLAFSQAATIDPKSAKRWTASLKESWMLTKGRFWPIFGRILLGGVLYGVFIGIILSVSTALVGWIAGPTQFLDALKADQPPPTIAAALMFIQGLVEAALIPIIPIFQIKLYQSLRKAQ